MMPGNNLRENWFMGPDPIRVRTWGDMVSAMDDMSLGFVLVGASGNPITLRMIGGGKIAVEESNGSQPA